MTKPAALLAYALLYLVTALLFLGLDVLWVSTIMGPMFEAAIPDLLAEEFRLGAAGAFYALYVVGILYFASARGLAGKPVWRVAVDGALFGFFAYGTFDATNYAVLRGYTLEIALTDTAWGTVFTAAMGVIGLTVTRAILGRRMLA